MLIGPHLAGVLAAALGVSSPFHEAPGRAPATLRTSVAEYPARRLPAAATPRIAQAFRNDTTATMWLSDNAGYIWQLDQNAAVVGVLTDCDGPQGIKTDHNGNLWAVCTRTGTIQKYARGATTATLVLNDTAGFFPSDVAVDPAGNVFATNLDGFSCAGSNCTTYPGDVVFWRASNLQAGALPSGTIHDPNVYEAFFLDTDTAGNVYVDMLNAAHQAGQTDEIDHALGHRVVKSVGINPGFPGGVYVSNGGSILNVLDQNALTIARYQLPSGPLLHRLGKLPENFQKKCDPIGFGFSSGDASVAVGDYVCRAVDVGTVSSNRFTQMLNASFVNPISAAFVVSDK